MNSNIFVPVLAALGFIVAYVMIGEEGDNVIDQVVASSTETVTTPAPDMPEKHAPVTVVSVVEAAVVEPPAEMVSNSAPTLEESLRAKTSTGTNSLAPADQCVEVVMKIMCPIFSRIPVVRDITGQIAVWGQISCPT
ncbi:hypothetical protein N9H39_06020 [Gammaproteobacteria bacterium]|jgi:hypothetical protein|nr:hypothetical protein [Gammaproteobacteria bacterium]